MDLRTPTRRSAALTQRPIEPAAEITRRLIVGGLLASGATVALLVASQLINFGAFDLRLRAFDSDYHSSVFGVVSLLAQAAVAAAAAWRGRHVEHHRWAWFGLTAIVAGLVVVRGLTRFNATALAVPLACVFCLLCWLTWRDSRSARLLVWSGLVLMAASLMLHKVGLAADSSSASDYTWPYQILTVVKHGCELAGWMLVATAIAASVERRPVLEIIATETGSASHRIGHPVFPATTRALPRRPRA